MTDATLMAHLDPGSDNDAVLRITATLAERFKASVIGIAACQRMPMVYGDAGLTRALRPGNAPEAAKGTNGAEASFRSALRGRVERLAWRSVNGAAPLADLVVQEARAADLIVTGPDQGWSAIDASRRVVISDVVLHAGRPVLVVPRGARDLPLHRVVVAWKRTREARRAIADALPLLKMAGQVHVVAITADDDAPATAVHLADVAAWLRGHGIEAQSETAAPVGDDAKQLNAIVEQKGADLLVAGAFGHNRFREWVLGGVTRELLLHPRQCAFLSH